MVNYWLCVANLENWEIIQKEKVWGVSAKNRRLLDRTEINDILIFYVKTRKLAGIFKITSKPFESKKQVFVSKGFSNKENFSYRVRIEPLIVPRELKDFGILIPKLGWETKHGAWRGNVRKAMSRVAEPNYKIIRRSIEEE